MKSEIYSGIVARRDQKGNEVRYLVTQEQNGYAVFRESSDEKGAMQRQVVEFRPSNWRDEAIELTVTMTLEERALIQNGFPKVRSDDDEERL